MDRTLRTITGLGLLGYGLLVLLGVMAHDAPVAGVLSLLIGVILLVPGLPELRLRRARLVAVLGACAIVGVLAYNLLVGSGLGLPEYGILVYGGFLVASAPFLERRVGPTDIATLVGWSFPLLFAPLVLFSVNAMIAGPAGAEMGAAAEPFIAYALVAPMAFGLSLLGTPAEVVDNNIILQTSEGTLALGVGLVCAGLYPMLLFLGVLGLHAWRTGMSKRRFAAYLGLGTLGLWLTNLARLVILGKVGERWGGGMLQTVHAHIGWLLFALFMAAFWGLVLRRLEPAVDASAE